MGPFHYMTVVPIAYTIYLKIWNGNPASIILFVHDCFGYLEIFCLPIWILGSVFSILSSKGWGFWLGLHIIYKKIFGRMVIFTVLILPVYKDRMLFHFPVPYISLFLSGQWFESSISRSFFLVSIILYGLFTLSLSWLVVCPCSSCLYVFVPCVRWFCVLPHWCIVKIVLSL